MRAKTCAFFLAMTMALISTNPSARAALLAYEGFDYPADSDLSGQNGGSGWLNPWSITTGDTNVLGSLQYTDTLGNVLTTTGNSAYFTALAGAANVQSRRTNTFVRNDGSGTTWVSFIAAYGGNDLNRAASFQLHTNASEKLSAGKGTTNVVAPGTWSILRGGAVATSVFTTNTITNITFMVLRIDHLVGANDDAYLFVNPPLNAEPATSDAAASMIGLADFSFNATRVFAAYASPNYADFRLDEIRIGETYADVTPFTSSAAGLKINSTSVQGGQIILSGNGGSAGGSFTVLTSSSLASPLAQWTTNGSGVCDDGGGFAYTNNASSASGGNFYRVRQP